MTLLLVLTLLFTDVLDEARMAIDRNDYAKARQLLTPHAEDDNVDAQLLLAEVCEKVRDQEAALRWYRRAADLKAPKAHYRLGLLAGSTAVAEKHWRKAAQAGHVDAKYRLGCLLLDKGKSAEGWRLLKEAGLAFHLEARIRIIVHVYEKKRWKFDAPVRQWVIEAAEVGHPEAQYRASFLTREEKEKLAWLEKAATQGHAKAQLRLGQRLVQAKEYEKAEPWLLEAAKQAEPEAAYELHSVNLRLKRGFPVWYGWLLTAVKMEKAVGTWDKRTRERRATYLRVQAVGRDKNLKAAEAKAAEFWKLVEPGVAAKK